jgi:hypothetical protein
MGRLLRIVFQVMLCVFYWSCYWGVIGFLTASLLAALVLVPAIVWPTAVQAFMPWYLNELPLGIVLAGFVVGAVLGFVRNVRIVLGETHRILFFAEVSEMAERIAEETAEEQGGEAHGFSVTPSSRRPVEAIVKKETGLMERQA